jgi:hypothetical protein
MVRSGELRARKFEKKFDPTVVSARFTNVKDLSVELQNAKQAELVSYEDQVRSIVGAAGIPTWQNVGYLVAMRRMYKKWSNFYGAQLENEILNIWADECAKGKDPTILAKIAALFGVHIPGYY